MVGMGERTIYATADCAGCSAPIEATGYDRDRHDVRTDPAGAPEWIDGRVNWAAWRHALGARTAAPVPSDHVVTPRPHTVGVSEAGRAVLDGTQPVPEPAPVHRYPHRVNWSDVEAFLRTIGLNPIDKETLMEIRIAPHGIEFTRARELPGRKVKYLTTDRRASMDDADAAKQVTTAQIRWSA